MHELLFGSYALCYSLQTEDHLHRQMLTYLSDLVLAIVPPRVSRTTVESSVVAVSETKPLHGAVTLSLNAWT